MTDSAEQALPIAVPPIPASSSSRMRRWGKRVLTSLAGQTAVQAVTLCTGFFLLRWMSVEDYAQFSVVFGFQVTLGMLVDLGFDGSIISLVGARGGQPEVIGGYIAAARWFRTGLFMILGPLAGAAFWFVGHKHGWPLGSQCILFGCVLVALYWQAWSSWYTAPLLIHQKLGSYYRAQTGVASGRLAACALMHAGGVLTAVTLSVINTATYAFTAQRYSVGARALVRMPPRSDPGLRQEMLRYILPQLPGIAFTALQGQLSVFLISFFGKSRNIAEVAALGRLGQIFVLFGALNATLVAPYFARVHYSLLGRRYAQLLGLVVPFMMGVGVLAFLFPQPCLWLLGAQYKHLEREFGWMVAANCVGFTGGVMMTVHSARKWIYWWGGFLYIALLTGAQAACVALLDLSTTISVLYLGLATNAAALVVHAATAYAGFRQERRAPPPAFEAPSPRPSDSQAVTPLPT